MTTIGSDAYQAIFLNSIDGVLFTAPDGTILAANPAACEILGRTEAEICAAGRAGLLAADAAITAAAIEQRTRTGKLRAELPMRRGDGEIFMADVSSAVFVTADGDERASVIFRDVSDRVRAQEALERQHRSLALLHAVTTVVNAATDVDDAIQRTLDAVGSATGWPLGDALLLDTDGVLRASSACRVADDDRFRWFHRSVEQTALPADQGLAGRVVTSGRPEWIVDVAAERVFVRGFQFRDVPIHCYVGVPIMVGQDVLGVLELFSDEPRARDDELLAVLTDLGTQLGRSIERSHAEAARDELEQEQALFISRAAHELRNPVAVLSLAGGVLAARDLDEDPDRRELVATIVSATERLNMLVHRLLDLSALEHGTLRLNVSRVRVKSIVERVVAGETPTARSAISCHVPTTTTVAADELALEQVLSNLVGNALRYGALHVDIEASPATDSEASVVISVVDDGPGVDPTIESSMFEPFVRSPHGSRQGSGLGLAITKRLVEAMAGHVRYERAAGGGSRFLVELPAKA